MASPTVNLFFSNGMFLPVESATQSSWMISKSVGDRRQEKGSFTDCKRLSDIYRMNSSAGAVPLRHGMGQMEQHLHQNKKKNGQQQSAKWLGTCVSLVNWASWRSSMSPFFIVASNRYCIKPPCSMTFKCIEWTVHWNIKCLI